MNTKILLFLFLFCYIIQIKAEYSFETIEELIPKSYLFDKFENSSYRILKYTPNCNGNTDSNTTNIYFQMYNNKLVRDLYLYYYDNYSNIEQDDNGFFVNHKLKIYLSKSNYYNDVYYNIKFDDLICQNDYYFIVFFFIRQSYFNTVDTKYFLISIINEGSNMINLSPLLSDYYTIIPRKENEVENLFYSFNETRFALIKCENINITLKENDIIIFENKAGSIEKIFTFKKDQKYNIYYNSPFSIHIYFSENENLFYKYNADKGPIAFFHYIFKNYTFEIDISNYEIGEYFVIHMFFEGYLDIKYQYKNDLKVDNYNNLGYYDSGMNKFNYITFQKTKNDSLILKIITSENGLCILNINKIPEITSNYNEKFKGPKLFLIDSYKLNNLKSFGIESNHNYILFEQELGQSISLKEKKYQNITIIKQNSYNSLLYKRLFIVFNTTDDDIYLKILKFNYSIFANKDYSSPLDYEYFQLCQGESTHKELYLYIEKEHKDSIITPVFGNYDSYFINENEIKTLTDLDFNKINETNFVQHTNENGFLKIKCQNPTMVRHIKSYGSYVREFLPGLKYFLFYEKLMNIHYQDYYLNRTFVNKAINKTIPFIPLKFSLLGVKQSSSIEIILDNKRYELNNSKSLEIEYMPELNDKGHIKFKIGDDIEKTMVLEVIVGNIKEILDKYEQIDFINSLGTLEIENKKGVIIKVPKDFSENLYDFSLILHLGNSDYYGFQIIYDRIEFIVSNNDIYYDDYRSITGSKNIPLFNTNPYLSIPKEERESNNKFIYILIYNSFSYNFELSIKKPKLFSDININKINRLP